MANQDLTVGKLGRVLRNYCLPLFGSVFFQQLYNLADSFTAGRYLGEHALAAVGNSYEITLIFLAFAVGCRTGSSITAARCFGAKQFGRLKTAVYTALAASGCLCALLAVGGLAFSAPLLRAIRTPDAIFADSLTYLRIYICGIGFIFFYNIATGLFAALGDSGTPFFFLILSSVANVVLDIVFVARLHWGIAGIGWATVLCQGCACVPALWMALRRIRALESSPTSPVTREALREFAECFSTIGSGVTNYTAQNAGACLTRRIREGFHAAIRLVWTISLALCLLYELIPEALIRVFLRAPSSDALRAGVDFLRVAAPFYFAPAFKIMCDAILCGIRRMRWAVCSVSLDLALRTSAAFLLSALTSRAFGVWFAWPVGWVAAAAATFVIEKKTKKEPSCVKALFYCGPPWGIRTHDQRNRNPVLYPAELRADVFHASYYSTFLKICKEFFCIFCKNSSIFF